MQDNWAIILAAGSSTRMGTQKLLLPYNNATMIETVVDNILDSKIHKVMVVLGADSEEITRVIGQRDVEYCHNQQPEKGMLSSVMCGFKALPQNANVALVYLGDQPDIPPAITNTIIEAYNGDLYGIVIPVHDHRRGHPLLVDLKYRRDIFKLDLEKGLRALMHLFPEDVLEVDVDEPGILVDIDTREDYSTATKQNQ
ncbi:MAG: nucleotidyltransferase family protein [Bacteroidota bacterium]